MALHPDPSKSPNQIRREDQATSAVEIGRAIHDKLERWLRMTPPTGLRASMFVHDELTFTAMSGTPRVDAGRPLWATVDYGCLELDAAVRHAQRIQEDIEHIARATGTAKEEIRRMLDAMRLAVHEKYRWITALDARTTLHQPSHPSARYGWMPPKDPALFVAPNWSTSLRRAFTPNPTSQRATPLPKDPPMYRTPPTSPDPVPAASAIEREAESLRATVLSQIATIKRIGDERDAMFTSSERTRKDLQARLDASLRNGAQHHITYTNLSASLDDAQSREMVLARKVDAANARIRDLESRAVPFADALRRDLERAEKLAADRLITIRTLEERRAPAQSERDTITAHGSRNLHQCVDAAMMAWAGSIMGNAPGRIQDYRRIVADQWGMLVPDAPKVADLERALRQSKASNQRLVGENRTLVQAVRQAVPDMGAPNMMGIVEWVQRAIDRWLVANPGTFVARALTDDTACTQARRFLTGRWDTCPDHVIDATAFRYATPASAVDALLEQWEKTRGKVRDIRGGIVRHWGLDQRAAQTVDVTQPDLVDVCNQAVDAWRAHHGMVSVGGVADSRRAVARRWCPDLVDMKDIQRALAGVGT